MLQQRWKNIKNFKETWNQRTETIASLIPNNSIVLEFGSGTLYLKSCLDDSCSYINSDLYSRDSETIVCDLNEPITKDFGNYDVVVFAGVLEYLKDVKKVINYISKAKTIICSYHCGPFPKKIPENVWGTKYSEKELIQIFYSEGFILQDIREVLVGNRIDEHQLIYKFCKDE